MPRSTLGVAACLLVACGGDPVRAQGAAEGASPHELCEAVGAVEPPSFYCVGEPPRTPVGTLGPRGRPLSEGLVARCWGGRAPSALRVEAAPLDGARLAFGFDLMADGRGRVPAAQIFPWAQGEAFFRAEPGAIVHVRYRFEKARRERVLGIREALAEAPSPACLEALCYGSYEASLVRDVARPRLTVTAGTGRVEGTGVAAGPGSTYEVDPHEEVVLATRVQPGPAVAGALCRASADAKVKKSAGALAAELFRSAPCLLVPVLVEILDTSCRGRPCPPEEVKGFTHRRFGDVSRALAGGCQALERELSRVSSPQARSLRCGPDLSAFAEAHASVPLDRFLSGGPETLALVRALLDDGSDPALAAAMDWLALRPGNWLDAQRDWEASRTYDGELPGLPAGTWSDFRVAVFRRMLDMFSRSAETDGPQAACEDAGVLWEARREGWGVIHRDDLEWPSRTRLLPTVTTFVEAAIPRLVEPR
jgi:hypothetical protein